MKTVAWLDVAIDVTGGWALVFKIPGRGWWADGTMGSPTGMPVGDVISCGVALNVAMFMDDLFNVPDCILPFYVFT